LTGGERAGKRRHLPDVGLGTSVLGGCSLRL
jgi:hypothetical protein